MARADVFAASTSVDIAVIIVTIALAITGVAIAPVIGIVVAVTSLAHVSSVLGTKSATPGIRVGC